MLSALKSFFLITLVTLTIAFFGWFFLRNHGLGKSYEPLEHTFLSHASGKPWLTAHRGNSAAFPENTLPAFESAAKLSNDIILWADIQVTSDQELVVFHDESLDRTTDEAGLIRLKTFAELQKLNAGARFQNASGEFPFRDKPLRILTLTELLATFPRHRLILNFVVYTPGLDQRIIKTINDAKAGDRVIIQSSQEGILRDLRKAQPQWLFGSSQAQMVQLAILASLHLEPVAPLRADVLITPLTEQGQQLVSDDIIEEIHRRKKKVLVGPVRTLEEGKGLLRRGVDGVITSHPEELLPLLK